MNSIFICDGCQGTRIVIPVNYDQETRTYKVDENGLALCKDCDDCLPFREKVIVPGIPTLYYMGKTTWKKGDEWNCGISPTDIENTLRTKSGNDVSFNVEEIWEYEQYLVITINTKSETVKFQEYQVWKKEDESFTFVIHRFSMSSAFAVVAGAHLQELTEGENSD